VDEVEAKLKQLEEELEAENEAVERAREEALASAEDEDREDDEDGEDVEDDDLGEDDEDAPPPPPRRRPKAAADDEDEEEDEEEGAFDAAAAALVTTAATHGGRSLTKRATKVAKQNLPALPSKSSIQEGALAIVGLGFAGMIAWHYLGWLLAIPLMILKAGALGAGLYGVWWLASRMLMEEEEVEDED